MWLLFHAEIKLIHVSKRGYSNVNIRSDIFAPLVQPSKPCPKWFIVKYHNSIMILLRVVHYGTALELFGIRRIRYFSSSNSTSHSLTHHERFQCLFAVLLCHFGCWFLCKGDSHQRIILAFKLAIMVWCHFRPEIRLALGVFIVIFLKWLVCSSLTMNFWVRASKMSQSSVILGLDFCNVVTWDASLGQRHFWGQVERIQSLSTVKWFKHIWLWLGVFAGSLPESKLVASEELVVVQIWHQGPVST